MPSLSDLQIRKFTTLFQHYDADKSGYLTAADYDRQARRVQEAFGWSGDDPRTAGVRKNRRDAFLRMAAASDVDQDGRVSLPEYLRYFEKQVEAHATTGHASPGLKQACREVVELCDQDGSGTLTVAEYAKFLQGIGSDADADAVFKRLDRDSDGKLTLADVEALTLEFILSSDPEAPGNLFYCGKL